MTAQLTPQQLEKIVETLPITGNGEWSVRQKIISRRDATSLVTSVSAVAILGPNDRHVGEYISPGLYKPHSGVTYWYVRQMAEAGWQETQEMIGSANGR